MREKEIVFRIRKTGKGVKVTKLDGTGLAGGIYTKPYQRYFYGDHAEEKAEQFAENKVHQLDETVRVVGLRERMS